MAEILAAVILLVSGGVGAVMGFLDFRGRPWQQAVIGACGWAFCAIVGALTGLFFCLLATLMLKELGL